MTANEGWPSAGKQLLAELRDGRGRVALVRQDPETEGLVAKLSAALEVPAEPAGQLLTNDATPPDGDHVRDILRGRPLLADLEVLFSPALHLDPLALLRRLSADGPVIAVWPGRIADRRAIYSELGRPDHYDVPLTDVLVLTPIKVAFPDEVPYELERIPA